MKVSQLDNYDKRTNKVLIPDTVTEEEFELTGLSSREVYVVSQEGTGTWVTETPDAVNWPLFINDPNFLDWEVVNV